MSVGVQREACRKMPQHTRHGLDVHSVLQSQRCEGVAQVVKNAPSAALPASGRGAACAGRCPVTWGPRWAMGIPIRCCPFFFFVASERLSRLPTEAVCGRRFLFSAASQ